MRGIVAAVLLLTAVYTLVVDTTNFSAKAMFMGATDNLHLVERFTRVAPGQIDYELTMDDPTTWARAWTARMSLRSTDKNLYEVACHEGDYSMEATLAGARAMKQQ